MRPRPARIGLLSALVGLTLALCAGCARMRPATAARNGRSDLALDPDGKQFADALANYAQGLILDEHNLHDEAVAHYEAAARLDPERTAIPIGIAMHHLHRNKRADAVSALEEARRAQPQSYDILLALALVYASDGRTDDALALYQEGTRIAPERFQAYLELANIYRDRKDDTRFHAVLDAALHRVDEPVPVLRTIGDYHIRQALAAEEKQASSHHYRSAIETYEKIAAEIPDDTPTRFRLGELHIRLNQYKEAMDCFRKISEEEPGFFFTKAVARLTPDNPTDSVPMLERAVALFPTEFTLLMTLGELYEGEEKSDRAEDCYRKARGLRPDRSAPYLRLSILYTSAKQADKALAVIEAGLAQKPDSILFQIHKGYILSKLKRYDEAIAVFEQTEKRFTDAPDTVDAVKPTFYFWFGACCERAAQYGRAETLFRTCLELDPRHDEAYNYLAYMWAERAEKLDEALAFVKKALAIQPENGAYADTLGWILYQRKEYEEALTELERAHTLMKDDPTIIDHLGDVVLILKGRAEALPYWERSLELDPDNAAVRKKIEAHRASADQEPTGEEPDEQAAAPEPGEEDAPPADEPVEEGRRPAPDAQE